MISLATCEREIARALTHTRTAGERGREQTGASNVFRRRRIGSPHGAIGRIGWHRDRVFFLQTIECFSAGVRKKFD